MASGSDSLHVGSIHLQSDYPIADVQVNHPEAAQAARAKIAALPEVNPLTDVAHVPAAPTVDLVTDKRRLASRLQSQPTVLMPGIPTALRPILTAAGVFVLVLLLFKSPVVISQVNYLLSKPKTAPAATVTAPSIIPAENTISIPKINVHAPVIYEPSVVEANIQRALQDGVVHYGTTAKPGQPGNVAIFGHSSNDWWEPGSFKFVFVLLDKLSPGDHVTVDYQSKRYTYEVIGSRVVEPTEVGVLHPTNEPTLTLITCSPAGTSLRRLVVSAKQIDPAPAAIAATPTPATKDQSSLPSAAPSFFDQIKKAWDGVARGFSSLFGSDKQDTDSNSGSSNTSDQLPAIK